MQSSNRWKIVVPIIVGLQISACDVKSDNPALNIHPATVEPDGQPGLNRLRLTARAAERLGIETAPIYEATLTRKRTVEGEVVAVPEAIGGDLWVRVRLDASDLAKVAGGQAARVLPLGGDQAALTAHVVGMPAAADPKETSSALYLAVDSVEHGLVPGQRVRVELAVSESGTQREILPYAALLYDPHGDSWTYTNPEPLVFVRQPVSVDYIDGDLVVLSDGPPAGTAVVTVGATELFGTEFGIGH